MKNMLPRLILVNAATIVVVLAVAAVTVSRTASDSFMAIMKAYGVETAELQQQFVTAARYNLLEASLAAALVGGLLSWVLTRRVVQPLSQMTRAAEAIAGGDYHVPLVAGAGGEVGQLAGAFGQMAASLARAQTLRRELVTNVGHELRTPLAHVHGYLEAMADGVAGPPEQALAVVQGEVHRLIGLVEAIHDLSRVDVRLSRLRSGGRLPPVSLGELVEGALSLQRPNAGRRGLKLEAQGLEGAPPVPGDAALLGQVVHNLLDNAIRYTPDGGRIRMALSPTEDGVSLQVGNSGPGIAADDLPYVFERFFRGDRSRRRTSATASAGESAEVPADSGTRPGGIGIGLAIVREVVTALGGRVAVASQPGWTEFTCAFPAHATGEATRR